ncbi:MAG: hypothetical protein IPP74_00775 [Alphaproteobacteria bacterium]|nr:hypothetical protein [Alphaproteobacteria bacterium]
MSVSDIRKIDMIGTSQESQRVVLTISDHLEWENDINTHLFILQEKINTYLGFIESNEIYKTFPDSINRDIEIRIYFKCAPPPSTSNFFRKIEEILSIKKIFLQIIDAKI